MFPNRLRKDQEGSDIEKIRKLGKALAEAEAVIIGAGAGLSASAGFVYTGERFQAYFSDFEEKYGFHDMYSGGFYPYKALEEYWAYWSRYIYVNRYMDPPRPVYEDLLELIKDKDYFILTTNVDHCFQKAGFEKERLFYTQGDYGLFQCSEPCCQETWDNEEIIKQMIRLQDHMKIPSDLVPFCPHCGKPLTMNLRADDTFVQDKGWYQASQRYSRFLTEHQDEKILFLELGVGYNTPVIIKYPFWRMTLENRRAVYVCVNQKEASAPAELRKQAICIPEDIGAVLSACCGRR